MSNRPRIELNTVQVVASMGAAVTGAVLTSYLGDGGTIVGTAVGSGASTAGFAVYKHYLARTKDKVAPVIVEHARQWSPTTQAASHAPTADEPAATHTMTSPNQPSDGRYGAYEPSRAGEPAATQANGRGQPVQSAPARNPDSWNPDNWNPAAQDADDGRTHTFAQPRHDAAQTRPDISQTRADTRADTGPVQFGTVRMGGNGHDAPDGLNGAGGNGTSGPGKHSRSTDGAGGGVLGALRSHPRWVMTAVTSVAVFLIAMLVITLIEFGTGKPIDASVWGRKSNGTTLGNVTSSTSTRSTPSPTTSATPATSATSATPTQSATSGSGATSTTRPTSGATSAPSPSSVPSVGATPAQTTPATTGATPPGRG